MKLIAKLLAPYMPTVTRKVIDQLLRDNDKLNREWRDRYALLEVEMWYWKDKYMDEVVYEPDKKT